MAKRVGCTWVVRTMRRFQIGCFWKGLLGKMELEDHREILGLPSHGANGGTDPCVSWASR